MPKVSRVGWTHVGIARVWCVGDFGGFYPLSLAAISNAKKRWRDDFHPAPDS